MDKEDKTFLYFFGGFAALILALATLAGVLDYVDTQACYDATKQGAVVDCD